MFSLTKQRDDKLICFDLLNQIVIGNRFKSIRGFNNHNCRNCDDEECPKLIFHDYFVGIAILRRKSVFLRLNLTLSRNYVVSLMCRQVTH